MDEASFLAQAIPLVLVAAVFYCIVVRPGRILESGRWSMVGALRPGDRIELEGGMLGVFAGKSEDGYLVELGGGVTVTVVEAGIKALAMPRAPEAGADQPPIPAAVE